MSRHELEADVVDLFGGPGGWSEACKTLDLTEIGIEYDQSACATRAAAGHLTIRANVATYPAEAFKGVRGLIASPPCPTFSNAGSGSGRDQLPLLHHITDNIAALGFHAATDDLPADTWDDPRTPLVLEPLRWVEALHPEWVALEQVPAIAPLWDHYAQIWRTLGYSTWSGILCAADYGVPQTRHRAILIASRTRNVAPPQQTHTQGGATTLFGDLAPWVTMRDALGWETETRLGFPRVDDTGTSEDGYRDRDRRLADQPAFSLTEKARSWTVDRRQNSRGPGGTTVPAALVPSSAPAPTPTLTSKAGGQWIFRASAQDHSAQRTLNEPAPTILASMDNGDAKFWPFNMPATTVAADPRITARCHHDEGSQGANPTTTTTVREGGYDGTSPIKLTEEDAARLQSFRPDYPWQGNRTKRFEQIGNAIPPLLALPVLRCVV